MPGFIYKLRFIIAIAFAALLLLSSGCKKIVEATTSQNALEQYFEQNILNRDFTVKYASDNGTDITSQFNGFTFRLLKNTYYDGAMTASNGLLTINGTWSCNSDYSKLVINLPTSIPAFSFINREWKFTKKAVPVMELAPWGTTEPDILHMERL